MKTKTNTLKVVGVSVPLEYADRLDAISRRERRTKRAIFEAMVDLYEETAQQREEMLDALVTQALTDAQREKRTNAPTKQKLLREYRALAEQGQQRIAALGMDPSDESVIDQLVYDTRKAQKTKKRS